MFIIEENGYSYLIFNVSEESFKRFEKECDKKSFYGLIGIEEFHIPKNNSISKVYYVECQDSREGRIWIEEYWINKIKLNCPNINNSQVGTIKEN